MANRYTEYNPQQYVSTYVPLPLELMYKGLVDKQKSYDAAEEKEGVLLDLQSKIKALDQVEAFGNTYNVKDKEYVREYFNKLNSEINDKADAIVGGDKSRGEYNNWLRKKSRELDSEMSTGKLGQINQAYNIYQEQQKAIAEAKDLGISAWRANQIDSNRLSYGQGEGYLSGNQLQKLNIGEYVDRNKEFDELSKGINSELTTLYAQADNRGYIGSKKIEEITEPKIRNMVRNFLPNSKTLSDIKEELDRKVVTGKLDPEDYNKALQAEYNSIEQAMVEKYRMSKGDQGLKSDATYLRGNDIKLEEERLYPTQQTKEGRTSKFMINQLEGLGVVDNDGKFDITKIRPSNIDQFVDGFMGILTMYNPADAGKWNLFKIITMKERLNGKVSYEDKQKAVAMAFNDMANFLGIDSYKVKRTATDDPKKVSDYNDILTAYSNFQESRGTALAYDERVSPGYSINLNNEATNYTYYDESGTELSGSTRDKLIADKKKVVTGRDYIPTAQGSKFAQEFKTEDGKTYYAQYKGDVEKNHYTALSKIINSQDQFIKNYRKGDKKVISSSFENEDSSKIAETLKSSPTMEGFDIATIDKSPDGQHIVVTKVNPSNPLEMLIDRYKISGKDYELTDYNVSTKDFVSQTDSDYGRSKYSYVKGYNYNKAGTAIAYNTESED